MPTGNVGPILTGGIGAGSGAGIAGGVGGAATSDLGTWYIYRATSGAYYGVNQLSGASVYTHATDAKSVWDSIVAVLPGTASTANDTRAGGSIEFGPHIFNVTGPLAITNRRSVTVKGQGFLQQTIIQQNAQFTSTAEPRAHAVMEFGTYTDNPILHGFEVSDFQIRGKRNDGTITVGGGITAWCLESNFTNVYIQATNDTGFFMNGTSGGGAAFTNLIRGVNVIGFGRTSTYTAYGIDLGSSVSDCDVEDCVAHQEQAYASAADNGDCGVSCFRNTGGTVRFLHCHAYFAKAHGYEATSAGNLSYLACIGESNHQNGLYVNGPDNVSVVAGGYYANSFGTVDGSGTENNIYFANVRQFSISNLTMAKFIAAAPNPSRNIFIDAGCSQGSISNCSFADATNDHIIVAGSLINIHNNDFLDGIAASVNGRTPPNAINLIGGPTNCKVHDNIVNSATQAIVETAGGWTGNYNEIYNNKIGAGGITLQDGTTYTSRKWGNRDLTNTKIPDRIDGGQGAQVTATGDMTLGHGKFFEIAGNTTINGIRTAGWDFGSEIWLVFTGTPTITNAGAPGAGFGKFNLAGAFAGTNNDTLGFILRNDGFWYEIGRNVIA